MAQDPSPAGSRAGVALVEDEATCLEGSRGDLRQVTLRHGHPIDCALFFSIAHDPVTDLGEQLGCSRTEDGYLLVDAEHRTTIQVEG